VASGTENSGGAHCGNARLNFLRDGEIRGACTARNKHDKYDKRSG